MGGFALYKNKLAGSNTAVGTNALANNTGTQNIALGASAGVNLTTGNYNICIGNKGYAGENRRIRIGTQGTQYDTYIAGISGVVVPNGVSVLIDSTGKLGTTTSSARFKENIQSMGKASETILALKPVTFHYKKELDADRVPQFGLVAEEVEKVNPDLVVRGEDGKVMTVRYEAVNAMLLNEFLKEHRTVAEQQAKAVEQQSTIDELKTTIAKQQKQIEALTAGLQKVSAAVELNKAAPTQVADNH